MMRRPKITTCLLLSFTVLCSFLTAQELVGEEEWTSQLALRYDPTGWPAKTGPVVAGLTLDRKLREKFILSTDHHIWLDVDDERIIQRHLAAPDRRTIAGVAVARTCAAAQNILFSHLARPRAMAPLDPPALPYGEFRMEGVGDVCFAMRFKDGKGFHSIEFTRFNVVVLLKAFDSEAAAALKELAIVIDQAIVARPLFKDWISSNEWPEIVRFEAATTRLKTNSIVPLEVSVSNRLSSGIPLVIDWEMSAGGIVKTKSAVSYHAEGGGIETLVLLVADERGLADYSRIEFEITR